MDEIAEVFTEDEMSYCPSCEMSGTGLYCVFCHMEDEELDVSEIVYM